MNKKFKYCERLVNMQTKSMATLVIDVSLPLFDEWVIKKNLLNKTCSETFGSPWSFWEEWVCTNISIMLYHGCQFSLVTTIDNTICRIEKEPLNVNTICNTTCNVLKLKNKKTKSMVIGLRRWASSSQRAHQFNKNQWTGHHPTWTMIGCCVSQTCVTG